MQLKWKAMLKMEKAGKKKERKKKLREHETDGEGGKKGGNRTKAKGGRGADG